MTRHATLPCILTFAATCAAASFGAAGAALASSRHLSIPANQLTIDSPCARQVIIQPDPTANGTVSVDATADHDEEIDELVLSGGDVPTLRGPERCWRPPFALDFRSTMAITVHVPPRTPLSISESGLAAYQLGDIAGPLTLQLSGDVHLAAGTITTLDADVSGSGTVAVGAATGNLHAELSGSGGVAVETGDLSSADLDLSGSGGFRLGGGSIGSLKLSIGGSAGATIGGTVGDATVEISGSGKVTLAKLTGKLSKDISGSGDVVIGSK